MWSVAVLDPALPGRSWIAKCFPRGSNDVLNNLILPSQEHFRRS